MTPRRPLAPTTIIRNAVRCTPCGEVVESKYRHDFRWCGCGATAVDGGFAYLKRTGGPYEELSEFGG